MYIKSIQVRPIDLPLKETFRTALGEKSVTRNVLVILEWSKGFKSYGEASSSLAMPEATQASMRTVLMRASQEVLGHPVSQWEELCLSLAKKFPGQPTAISALECALLDGYCRSRKKSLAWFFGNKNEKIETFYTIGALEIPAVRRIVKGLAKDGFKKFKLKITGKDLKEDIKRIEAVHRLVPRGTWIVDANQGLNPDQALELLKTLEIKKISIALLEQPLPKGDLNGLKYLKDRSVVPIGVDESIRSLEDAKRIVEEDAAQVFNIKIAKMGLLEALKAVKYLKSMKKKLMIGCMMESAIGLSTAVQWAAGSGAFEFVDLDSFLLLRDLPYTSGFTHRGPRISLKAGTVGSGTNDL